MSDCQTGQVSKVSCIGDFFGQKIYMWRKKKIKLGLGGGGGGGGLAGREGGLAGGGGAGEGK